MREVKRQFIHIGIGVAIILLLLFLGRIKTLFLISVLILAGLVLVHLFIRKRKVPIASWFLEAFERKNVMPGHGSLWYLVGCLFVFILISNNSYIIAVLIILALGDGFATLIGMKGKKKIFYNKNKTYLGTGAFVIASLPALLFAPPFICLVAIFLSAVVESIDFGIDDNLVIPIICSIVFSFA